MAVQIQLRRGTAAQWSSVNPIIAEGEICVELDTHKFKVGNGILHWNDLQYTTNQNTLALMDDVDTSTKVDGSLLIYETGINKWKASTDLTKQNLDGGEF
jgi:hypothetical protein